MRYKEEEQEYRYFPEPDLIPLHFESTDVERLRAELPELPDAKRERFVSQYRLRPYDAEVLTSSRAVANYFENAAKGDVEPQQIANYVTIDLMKLVNASGTDFSEIKITPSSLRELIQLRDSGEITNNIAKSVLDDMFKTGRNPKEIIESSGIKVVSDEGVLIAEIDRVVAANKDVVAKIKAGNEKSIGFLVGQIMKATKGQARPDLVNKLLKERIG